MLYPGWDIVARGISIKRSPFQYILLHYFHLYLQIAPGVLSRALPASPDESLSSTGKLNVNSPISVPESTKQDKADWPENMHWVRCITGPPVDEIVEFGCTMMDYGLPPHKQSSKIVGRDFPADEVTLDHKIENQARVIDLHPCFLQTTTGRSILVCEAVDQALDESSVDAGLHALAVDLINGLPISIDSELKFPPKFDRHLPRLVSIYPSGEEYHILMTNTTQNPPPLETHLSTPDHQRGTSKNRYTERLPPAKAARQKAQGFLEGSLLIRCWFWLDEQAISVLICTLVGEAELSIIDFADSGFESNSESNTNKTYLKQRSSPEILVDRWFLCWTGSGPKMLCEIPDWYTGDYHHPQSKHIRKATLQTHEGKVYTPLLPKADMALHFLVDSPPLWQRCRPTSDPKLHAMRCVEESTNRAIARRSHATKSSEANQTSHRRGSDPLKGVRIVSNEPSHNITSLRCGPGKTSAFGKMGETFAFIGFFTVLVVFTIVLSWLVKHLFLAIYDGLEEWTDSRRRKRTLATSKDFGIGGSLDNRAPAYDSTDCGFQRPVNTVPFPQAAMVNEEATTAISTTGSQTLDGGSDSIKRKKAAMRATVSEEVEP